MVLITNTKTFKTICLDFMGNEWPSWVKGSFLTGNQIKRLLIVSLSGNIEINESYKMSSEDKYIGMKFYCFN